MKFGSRCAQRQKGKVANATGAKIHFRYKRGLRLKTNAKLFEFLFLTKFEFLFLTKDICKSNTKKVLNITAFNNAISATPVPIIVCSLARSFDYLSKVNDYNHLVSSTYKVSKNKSINYVSIADKVLKYNIILTSWHKILLKVFIS